MIYWRVKMPTGKLVQRQFYWGAIPVRKLELILQLINNRPPRHRQRIAKMIGIKTDDLSLAYLGNSDFLIRHVFGVLKTKVKSVFKGDKRYLRGQERREGHERHWPNYYSKVLIRATRFIVAFKKLESEENGMADWNMLRREMLFEHLKPVKSIIEKVEKLIPGNK